MLRSPPRNGPRQSPRSPRIVIAGGYTGGHIHCALAIAAGIRRARPGAEVLFVGARGGPEVAAVRAAGYPIETVWIAGLERRLSARAVVASLLLPLKLAVSAAQAGRILRRFRPDVVVGVGAFPSAPIVAAAQGAGIPTLLHEANALPGIANRLLARRARVICLGMEQASRWFPDDRTVLTGNPLRADLAPAPTAEARARLGLAKGRPTLLVSGGSLGSPALNRWVLAHQHDLDMQVLWQCGPAHHAASAAALRAPLRLVPFLDDMPAAYAAADLVVAAAGGLTLAELAHLGKPAIIVPTAVAEDHQLRNALPLERRGLAVCREADLETRLAPLVTALMGDEARRRALGQQMAELAAPDATARIVAELERLLGASR